jgi:LuxR family maltose regulon positive regulatory protein
MKAGLLTTKLHIPSVRPELVSRSRLAERLNAGLGRKLILVSAPAGFGKTTLLSAWAASCGHPVAWLSLDERDNDPARFLAYLVAALQMAGVEIEESAVGDVNTPAAIETLLTALINQINAVSEHFVLALDDYHLITAQPVHDALTFLLDHLPDQMHLAIATRADPPLPVARLRGRGQLTELRLVDLRFTREETVAFLNRVMGLVLSDLDIAALAACTEGWITGLQMAALSLQGKEDVSGFIAAFTGSNRYILDYFLAEVLRREPERVQGFLLQTSILERLCAPLCDAILPGSEPAGRRIDLSMDPSPADSRAVLEYLERANLFVVPIDDRREWYRYHRLFSDLLRQRLHQMYPDRVPGLHRRASRWLEQNGLMAEAIDHALAAEDLDRAADLIEANAEATLMRGEVSTFLRWVDALPDGLLRARPALSILYAWMLLWQGQSLKLIESLLRDVEEGDERVAGRVTALRGLMAGLQGQVEHTVELCSLALKQLPEKDQFVRTFTLWLLRTTELVSGEGMADMQALDDVLMMSQMAGNVMLSVMIACNRAELLMRQGRPHEAVATYQKAVELATDAQGRRMPIAGQALIGLGELSREWGDLDAAEHHLIEGIELTERWTEVGPLEAYIALARVRWAQGDMESAWDALRKAQELAVKFDLTDLDDLSVAIFQASMWISQGNLEPARRWAEGRDLFRYIDTPLQEETSDSYDLRIRKYELLVLARLLIVQERSGEALKLLESLIPAAEWRGRPGMLVEIHVLQALACQAQGDLDRAMDALECALSLAEPKGYVSVFTGEGEPMRVLLREAVKRGVVVEYAGRLLAAFKDSKFQVSGSTLSSDLKPETFGPETLAESLSERELEVLRLLNTHLSSTEIAEQLYISVNTVRYHIKNIYGKLGVHSRSEAVQRVGELGLLKRQ